MMTTLPPFALLLLGVAFLAASALYASVGHGGASAYLAVMGLCGLCLADMKPIALVLNIAVSALAMLHFMRAGHFSARLFWPLVAGSVPAAFLGGWLQSADGILTSILAVSLLVSAWRLVSVPAVPDCVLRQTSWLVLLALGSGIGFVSGLIGIGGGIFLTPLLVMCRWTSAKTAAALSAAFILANSCSGIAGFILKGSQIPSLAWGLLPCVLCGGWIGSRWGSCRATSGTLRRVLAAVLVVAAAKFCMI
jgi:uncharacterized protein